MYVSMMADLSTPRRPDEQVTATVEYRDLLQRLRIRIGEAQGRAVRAVNTELVMLYWSIGREILEEQERLNWGDDVIGRISQDLRADGGSARGFSRRNLFYMRSFARLWPDQAIVQTLSAQLGWSHQQVLLDAFGDDRALYEWYVATSVEHRWSVRFLKVQIDLRLHERAGAATTNFDAALGSEEAVRALEVVKDPYVLPFLGLEEGAKERDLEQALVHDIQKFLTELGWGFAFYGRQYPLLVGGQEFILDLLFYHHTLRRFVVIELKIGEFQVEHAGKMNFYLNAVDELLRQGDDQESVGIILTTGRNETVAQLAMHRVQAPIAVSTWQKGGPQQILPPAELIDAVPADQPELAQLEEVRDRLAERVERIVGEAVVAED